MRTTSLLTTALLIFAAARPARAQGSPDPLTLAETIRGEIQASWLAGDRPRLEAARKRADRATVLYPKEALLYHYLGYAVYRTIELPKIALSPEARDALLTQGLDALATANKLTPMAESYILRWPLLAQTITDAGSAMAVVGAMQDELAQATRLGKDNPRVSLVNGIGTFFTPPMWGGGPEAALAAVDHGRGAFQERSSRQRDARLGPRGALRLARRGAPEAGTHRREPARVPGGAAARAGLRLGQGRVAAGP